DALGVDEGAARGPAPAVVQGAAYDSRRVKPGDAFFALSGQHADGARFAGEAARDGAVCVVAEAPTGVAEADPAVGEVLVGEARRALAVAARTLYRDPSSRLRLVGLTGTNGKTTTAFLTRAILVEAGMPAGLVGTAGYDAGEGLVRGEFTTPEAPELCDLLDAMSARGLAACVLEVSSHALSLRRAFGLSFASVVFTNLTRDHLDFHGSEEAYLEAKLRLFDGQNGGRTAGALAVVHVGDPHAPEVLAACAKGGMRVVRFALEGAPGADTAELSASDIKLLPRSTRFTLVAREGGREVRRVPLVLPLAGRHNVENALAAWGAAAALGAPADAAVRALTAFRGVPGRLEAIERGQPFAVFVDYAHTPDALERVLAAVRATLPDGARLGVVFGCGGDRDRGKRGLMGQAAVRGADFAIVTDDNPRNESPGVIRGEAMKGALEAWKAGEAPAGADAPDEIAGRRRALEAAFGRATPGDAVIVAGKGHEVTQSVAGQALPFDDRREARRALEALGWNDATLDGEVRA
ncbi:MAG: UDP-N-acetylmuramoyl-L-alanyl-D-glutamate--2,6-diaminopimelate ligase, partial [Candidatus Eisenbacteria bacterium]